MLAIDAVAVPASKDSSVAISVEQHTKREQVGSKVDLSCRISQQHTGADRGLAGRQTRTGVALDGHAEIEHLGDA